MSTLPRFFKVRQSLTSRPLEDIEGSVRSALDAGDDRLRIRPGQTVALAVGSRGIRNLDRIVAEVVRWVRSRQCHPRIVPAMGSHGGATAEGQAAILASYGIDERSMGCPVVSSMDAVEVGRLPGGLPVMCDATAHGSDRILVINRVKPHTRLTGKLQSGLIKMLLIGIGKQVGARSYHQRFVEVGHSLDAVAPQAIPILLDGAPVAGGLAIIEDAFDQTAHLECVAAGDLLTREVELQAMAARWMPRLPFDSADLLIVDQMGKEISGTGMDTNVIGRKWHDKIAGPDEFPKIRQIYVRGLTPATKGNACGIGIAEYCHAGLVRDIDAEITKVNCLTARHVSSAAIPIHYESDQEVLQAALSQALRPTASEARWMHIRDTLTLGELACSEAYWDEANEHPDLEIAGEPTELRFDDSNNNLVR